MIIYAFKNHDRVILRRIDDMSLTLSMLGLCVRRWMTHLIHVGPLRQEVDDLRLYVHHGVVKFSLHS